MHRRTCVISRCPHIRLSAPLSAPFCELSTMTGRPIASDRPMHQLGHTDLGYRQLPFLLGLRQESGLLSQAFCLLYVHACQSVLHTHTAGCPIFTNVHVTYRRSSVLLWWRYDILLLCTSGLTSYFFHNRPHGGMSLALRRRR